MSIIRTRAELDQKRKEYARIVSLQKKQILVCGGTGCVAGRGGRRPVVKKYGDLYLEARRALMTQEDAQTAGLMARNLIALFSGQSQEYILSNREMYAGEETCEKTEMAVKRLLKGEPLAYVLGEWEFYGLPLYVNENVLIPRDDTVPVATLAIKQAIFLPSAPRILDLCTGSGCIGLAVASRIKDARVTLADISKDALAVAKKNIARNKMTGRVSCVQADALKPAPAFLGKFDMIISNPPYITGEDMPLLEDSVKLYEPHLHSSAVRMDWIFTAPLRKTSHLH